MSGVFGGFSLATTTGVALVAGVVVYGLVRWRKAMVAARLPMTAQPSERWDETAK